MDYAKAKCATKSDPWEIFFPSGEGITDKVRYAKAICNGCPIAVECLAQAMAAGPECQGVWGMTTTTERAAMRKDKKLLDIHIKKISPKAE